MSKELVSVIIPCYNGGKYLAQALESVRLQTYPHWECILIDDGSIDDSKEIFKSFMERDKRFKYVYQENQGPAIARNKGVDIASGDFIQFLDADDILLPERFELCINQFKLNPAMDVVYTNYICFDKATGFSHFLPAKIPYEDVSRSFMFYLDIEFVVLIHSVLFRKKVVKENKFNEELGSFAEDVECWIRIALSGAKFLYLNKILSIYRRNKSALTNDEISLFSAKLKVMQKYRNHTKSIEYNSEYSYTVQHYRERLAIAYLMNKKFKKGINEMKIVWSSASIYSKIKFIFWFILMRLFKKRSVFRFRAWLLRRIKEKDKSIQMWEPSEQVIRLLNEVS